jgi:uncharacterized lipoprotein
MDHQNTWARRAGRSAVLALLAVAIIGASGCGWFRGRSGYEDAPEARPLEVPPDLDMPRVDPAMNIPATPSERSAAASAAASAPFTIADAADSAWRRVGLALDRIDGVTITDRAQLLSAYSVRYQGEEFLVRVVAEGSGSRISATSADGRESTTAAATRLLGLLRQRLG